MLQDITESTNRLSKPFLYAVGMDGHCENCVVDWFDSGSNRNFLWYSAILNSQDRAAFVWLHFKAIPQLFPECIQAIHYHLIDGDTWHHQVGTLCYCFHASTFGINWALWCLFEAISLKVQVLESACQLGIYGKGKAKTLTCRYHLLNRNFQNIYGNYMRVDGGTPRSMLLCHPTDWTQASVMIFNAVSGNFPE